MNSRLPMRACMSSAPFMGWKETSATRPSASLKKPKRSPIFMPQLRSRTATFCQSAGMSLAEKRPEVSMVWPLMVAKGLKEAVIVWSWLVAGLAPLNKLYTI